MLRNMMQMSAMMRAGPGGAGGAGGAFPGSFPAPGNPSSTPGTGMTNPTLPSATAQPGAIGTGTNPTGVIGGGLPNPALLQALLGAGPFGGGGGGGGLGGGGLGGSGFGGGFGPFGAAPAAVPADSRPPEERFQVQLQVRLNFVPANHDVSDFSLVSGSNCKIWVSPTRLRTCAHFLPPVATFMLR